MLSHATFCLHLRDTIMVDSNGCQVRGHVGENQEYGLEQSYDSDQWFS